MHVQTDPSAGIRVGIRAFVATQRGHVMFKNDISDDYTPLGFYSIDVDLSRRIKDIFISFLTNDGVGLMLSMEYRS